MEVETETLSLLWIWITDGSAAGWIVAFTTLVTAATGITALTPTTIDNKILNVVLKILNFLAGNILKNRNADTDKI